MKKQDLLNRLSWVLKRTERSIFYFKIYQELSVIISDLSIEWIEVENFIQNKIQFCWNCHQKVSLRKKKIDLWMVSWLIKAFNFVMKYKRQTFQIQEIDLNPQEYSKLNNLVRFWLLYKSDDMWIWEYWVPRRTVSRFLAWEWKVAEFYKTDPTKKEWEEGRRVMSEKRITIHEIPSVSELRKLYWESLTEYEWNEDFE